MENLVEIHITIIALNDVRLWLDGTNYLLDTCQFIGFHFCSLIEEDDIAELNLLNHKIFYIFLCNIGLLKSVAITKFILHT